MKKLLFYPTVLLLILSCNQGSQTTATAPTDTKSAGMTAYEKNLAVLKTGIASVEKQDIEAWASVIADSVEFKSPAYGDTVTTKQHWKDMLSGFIADWDSLKLQNPLYLPGLDTVTFVPDGSVRFYGTWTAVHKSGKRGAFKFYGVYDFNADSKVRNADEYFDISGIMASVNSQK